MVQHCHGGYCEISKILLARCGIAGLLPQGNSIIRHKAGCTSRRHLRARIESFGSASAAKEQPSHFSYVARTPHRLVEICTRVGKSFSRLGLCIRSLATFTHSRAYIKAHMLTAAHTQVHLIEQLRSNATVVLSGPEYEVPHSHEPVSSARWARQGARTDEYSGVPLKNSQESVSPHISQSSEAVYQQR